MILEKSIHDELNPPDELKNSVGGVQNFEKVGKNQLEGFVKLGNLTPDEDVLDVGCGCGRTSIPLTSYLKNGKYEGFDLNSEAIAWCKEKIEPRFQNFHFSLIDLKNHKYNNEGKIEASNLKFPFEDQSFDFVALTSVFTHLLPNEIKNYLKEVSRVLRNNGRSYITYLLLNDETRKRIDSGISRFKFEHKFDGYYSDSTINPPGTVGYEEKFIRSLYEENDLKIINPIFYGSWSGVDNSKFGQDVVVAIKNSKT